METQLAKPMEGLKLPPPLLYIGAGIVAMILQAAIPLTFLPNGWTTLTAAGLIALAMLLAAPSLRKMLKAGNSLNPNQTSERMISDGVYRLTRNPMYLSLTLGFLGIGLLARSAWFVIFLIPLVLVMHYRVILPE